MATASSKTGLITKKKIQTQSALVIWKRLMTYLLKYKLWVITALIGIIGSNTLAVMVPYILRDVVDIGIAEQNGQYMLNAGLLVVGLGIVRGLSAFLGRFFGERLSHYVSYDIRNDIYEKVQRQSFTYHDNSQVGTIITRAISDVNEIQRYFAFGLMDGLNVVFLLFGVVAIMIATHPLLALISFCPLVPLALFSNRFVMLVHPRWKKVMDRMQVLSNHLQENALGAEVVRVFAREQYEIKRFHAETDGSTWNSWISSASGLPFCRPAHSWQPCPQLWYCSSVACSKLRGRETSPSVWLSLSTHMSCYWRNRCGLSASLSC